MTGSFLSININTDCKWTKLPTQKDNKLAECLKKQDPTIYNINITS